MESEGLGHSREAVRASERERNAPYDAHGESGFCLKSAPSRAERAAHRRATTTMHVRGGGAVVLGRARTTGATLRNAMKSRPGRVQVDQDGVGEALIIGAPERKGLDARRMLPLWPS